MRWLLTLTTSLLLTTVGLLVVAGAARAQNYASGYVEQYFKFEWEITQGKRSPVMKGYIYNNHGSRAVNVRVLVIELDAAGQAVKRTASWVPSGIPGKGRAYFEVPVEHADAGYRVTLESFDWMQEGKQT